MRKIKFTELEFVEGVSCSKECFFYNDNGMHNSAYCRKLVIAVTGIDCYEYPLGVFRNKKPKNIVVRFIGILKGLL